MQNANSSTGDLWRKVFPTFTPSLPFYFILSQMHRVFQISINLFSIKTSNIPWTFSILPHILLSLLLCIKILWVEEPICIHDWTHPLNSGGWRGDKSKKRVRGEGVKYRKSFQKPEEKNILVKWVHKSEEDDGQLRSYTIGEFLDSARVARCMHFSGQPRAYLTW